MESGNLYQSSHVIQEGIAPISNEGWNDTVSSRNSLDLATCRVCQCSRTDKRGDAVLEILRITPPSSDTQDKKGEVRLDHTTETKDNGNEFSAVTEAKEGSTCVEIVSPDGEVLVCDADIETGSYHNHGTLIELGCDCKNDLALVHYACALKWFVNHGSTNCEICGCKANHIRDDDFNKVVNCLKAYNMLRERTFNGEPVPDAVAAIRSLRLSEISLWFNPCNRSAVVSLVTEQAATTSDMLEDEAFPTENRATKWAVEGTGVLLATGLLTFTLAWLIAPHVGKNTAKNGLHILLGGVCALTLVVFFRFVVLARIQYGPARYWAMLFVFWFLVFGIWASRTHST
ncbi:unnamed protein product [Cuscuta epithymum]|uniref:RING-CH-type domain-containing protein n=2 Tax=Cuscuta epithymum TaxID=186058 RepID=A0AAV0G6P6_9ASTE|nr:unnamed protein product [Cuscuta epithymum]